MSESEEVVAYIRERVEKLINEAVSKVAERIGNILVKETVEVLKNNKKVDTGDLRKSINYKVRKLTKSYVVQLFSNVDYAVYVHDGTKPHFPPINKLAAWVRRKRLAGKYSMKTKRRLGNKLKQRDEDRALATAIARKIAKRGTKGLKFFEIALKQAVPVIEREIKRVKIV